MKRRFLVILLISIFGCTSFTAEADFLKKVGKGLKQVDKALSSSKDSGSRPTHNNNSFQNNNTSTKNKKRSKAGITQQGEITIDTGTPDIKIKIKRCEASSKMCVIDFTLENVSEDDYMALLNGGNSKSCPTIVFDDEGNSYSGKAVKVCGPNTNPTANSMDVKLISEIPLKFRIQIWGIPTFATSIKRVNLGLQCKGLEIGLSDDDQIRISNIPIHRDGDD